MLAVFTEAELRSQLKNISWPRSQSCYIFVLRFRCNFFSEIVLLPLVFGWTKFELHMEDFFFFLFIFSLPIHLFCHIVPTGPLTTHFA